MWYVMAITLWEGQVENCFMIEKTKQDKAIADGYNNVNKDYINEFLVVITFFYNKYGIV